MNKKFLVWLEDIRDLVEGKIKDPMKIEAWYSIPHQIRVFIMEYLKNYPHLPKSGLPDWAVAGAIKYGVGLYGFGVKEEKERREKYGY